VDNFLHNCCCLAAVPLLIYASQKDAADIQVTSNCISHCGNRPKNIHILWNVLRALWTFCQLSTFNELKLPQFYGSTWSGWVVKWVVLSGWSRVGGWMVQVSGAPFTCGKEDACKLARVDGFVNVSYRRVLSNWILDGSILCWCSFDGIVM